MTAAVEFFDLVVMTFVANGYSRVDSRQGADFVDSGGAIMAVLAKRFRDKELPRDNQHRKTNDKEDAKRYELLRDAFH